MDIVEKCRTKISDATDGKDALQYATYTIKQGPYTNKTILAFMGTDIQLSGTNIEQVFAALWSTPMGSEMIRTMASEAEVVANRLQPDFITGHSLGGLVAEMVCSMTGIKGASFGAIGAFDPFSRLDEGLAFLDELASRTNITESIESLTEDYRSTLLSFGYDIDDIAKYISNVDVGNYLTRAYEYNGFMNSTLHDGVEFEVVMNVHDVPARGLSSMDGSACSHIASSCDLRWTWFGGGTFYEHTLGHSSADYGFNVISKWTRGYDKKNVNEDFDKIFLPGVKKNVACDFCDRNEYCESNSCNLDLEQCSADGGKLPTLCPSNSVSSNARSDCEDSGDCSSNRCEFHSNPVWAALGYGQCYDRLGATAWCNEHSDCSSNYCNTFFTCANKKYNGARCLVNGDCHSNNCNWWFKCK